MKKIFICAILGGIALLPQTVSAQQTLEQATDSIKLILKNAREGKAEAQNEVGM